MLTEVLVCMSFNDLIDTSEFYVPLRGKQYCWMEESDYKKLKKETIHIYLKTHKSEDISCADLKLEKIKDQKLIDAVLELGPEPLSSCQIEIYDRIGYRSYPRHSKYQGDKYDQRSGFVARIAT